MALMQFVLGGSAYAFALCALVLLMRRADGDRSRRILGIVWLLMALLLVCRALTEVHTVPSGLGVLPPANLVGGLLTVTLLCLYPIEVIRPGWLNVRRTVCLLLPTLFLGVFCRLPGVEFRHLHSFEEILAHIGEPDVWGRLVLLFGFILPSALLLHVIPYNWMKSRVRLSWIKHYTCIILLISALYAAFMLTRCSLISVAHLLVCLALTLIVTYEELFTRFRLPADAAVTPSATPALPSVAEDNPLVVRLNRLLEEKEVWQNPDLTVSDLAQMLGTNRTYLSRTIQEAGYANFADLMNRRRVEAFCRMAEEGRMGSVQDALFRVGFRSKETALRCFKKYTGMLPSKYVMTVVAGRAKTSELQK